MGESASSVDRISELPDFILHQILSLLPTQEAARTCILSKRWHYIWETFPVLDCRQWYFGFFLDLLNTKKYKMPKDRRCKIFHERVRFMSYVDKKLQQLFGKDICVKRFCLEMTLVGKDLVSRIDSWMELVTVMSVQELDLHFTAGTTRFYTLPMKVLASQSLTFLSLRGRISIHCLNKENVKLCSLVELHLQEANIDKETIENLIFSIPSMEVFSLKGCLDFSELAIHSHEKLKKIVFLTHKDAIVKKISVNLRNIEELDFGSADEEKRGYEIIVSPICRKLKRLSLRGISIDAKSLLNRISSFPLLEHLFLDECLVKEAAKVSSSILKEVCVRNCLDVVKAEFDTPRLHVFRYHSKSVTFFSLNNVTGNRIAEFPVYLSDMIRIWFLELSMFIGHNRFQDLVLTVSAIPDDKVTFSAEHFMEVLVPLPFEMESITLVMFTFTSLNYGALLDGLLWKLRPKTLSLRTSDELHHYSPPLECLKGLLKSLVEEEPNCCCSEYFKCWRHSLKEIITSIDVRGIKTGTPLNRFTLSSFYNFLDDWEVEAHRIMRTYEIPRGVTLSFKLSWQDSL